MNRKIVEILRRTNANSLPAVLAALRQLEPEDRQGLKPVRVRVLRNYTLDNLAPFFQFASLENGLDADMSFADFDVIEPEVRDSTSNTNTAGYQLIVITLVADGLLRDCHQGLAVEEAFQVVRSWIVGLHNSTSATIVVTTFLDDFSLQEGVWAGQAPGGIAAAVRKLNGMLYQIANDIDRLVVIDLSKIVALVGATTAFNRRFWYMFARPFNDEFLAHVATRLAEIAGLQFVAPKKLLVLDCDQTLWGGVIGEEGIDGIELGPHHYPGNTFYDFQRQILALKAEGVMLALCSKNNENDVFEVLERHPNCLLKKEDFVAWQINWQDKAQNLRSLAEILNIGLDSFVFIDDSLSECELIRTYLPMVTVLQVPTQLYKLPELLRSSKLFDRLTITAEDRGRTQMYRDQGKREAAAKSCGNMEGFLASLDLTLTIRQASVSDVARLAQLTAKTNQFNLVTKRYTETEVSLMLQDDSVATYVLGVRDRFGDYGQTGLAILQRRSSELTVDSFLMSCRVLGKAIEFAFLRTAIEAALKRLSDGEVRTISASYIPTKKNVQVSDFYDRANFRKVQTSDTGTTDYVLSSPGDLPPIPGYVRIITN